MEQQEHEQTDNPETETVEAETETVAAEETVADETTVADESSDDAEQAETEEASFDPEVLKPILEALLISADRPLPIKRLQEILSDGDNVVSAASLREVLNTIAEDFADRSMELVEVSSGYRFQVRENYAQWVQRLWEEKPQRYSRALLETLAIIAYRQPITRGEIEDIRGVSVSSSILKTLQEREWCRVVGHRDVPGKPAMFATSKGFLDYFSLKSLDDLPTLAELRDIDSINAEFDFEEGKACEAASGETAEADTETATAEEALTETAEQAEETSEDIELALEDDDDMEAEEEAETIAAEMAVDEDEDDDKEDDTRLKNIVDRFYGGDEPGEDEEEDEDESLSDIVDALEEKLEDYEEQDADDDGDRP